MKHHLVALSAILAGCAAPPPPKCAEMPPAQPSVSEGDQGQPATEHDPPSDPGPDEHGAHGHHAGHGQHGGPLVHGFDGDPAKWAKRFEGPERDGWQKPEQVIAKLALKPGMRVADVGAGTGYFMPHLSKAVGASGQVVAVDIEPTMVRHMIDRAERDGHANVVVRLAVPADPLLSQARLDRILVVDTWHHIPDRVAYTKKLMAALKPGGQLHVVDFKLSSDKGPPKKHKLAAAKVKEELEAAGLTVAVDEATLPEQYIAIGTKPAE